MKRIILATVVLFSLVAAFAPKPTSALAANGDCPAVTTVDSGRFTGGTASIPVTLQGSESLTMNVASDSATDNTAAFVFGPSTVSVNSGTGQASATLGEGAGTYVGVGLSFDPAFAPSSGSYTLTKSTPSGCVTHYQATDGRVNPTDAQQTNTAYCGVNGDLRVFKVVNSQGIYLFTVGHQAITDGLAKAKQAGKPVLLGAKESVQVWALVTNQLQLVDARGGANPYHAVFAASFCG